MFERLGSLTFRFRFPIVLAWIAGAAWAVLFAPSLAAEGMTDQTAFLPPSTASMQAHDALERAFPGSTSVSSTTLVFSRAQGLTDADHAYVDETAAWIVSDRAPAVIRDAVAGVDTATSRPELESLLRSSDGSLEMVNVNLDVVMAGSAGDAVVGALRDRLATTAPAGLEAHVTGAGGIGSDYLAAIVAGTDSTTLVTVLLVVIILLVIYRAPLAAMVPLLTIGAAFLVARGTLGVLALMGWKVSSLIDTFIVVLIFGVGTDYAIFLISRFREEVAKGDWHDAARTTVGRIGAVISASAATVIVGLGAMAFGDFGMIQTTGPALAIGIAVTLLAGLTLTPALLGIFGHYLFWPRHAQAPGEATEGFFARLASLVSRRPGTVTVVLLAVLLVPALQLPQMRTNFDVLEELPASSDARVGFDAVAAHLGKGEVFQGTGIIDAGAGADLLEPASLARLLTLMQELQADPGVGSVTSIVTPEGDGTLPDGLRPSWQLAEMADGFAGDGDESAPEDAESLLDPEVSDGLTTVGEYLAELGGAFPDVAAGPQFRDALADLETARDQVDRAREGAVVSTQLRSLADAMTSPAAAAGSGGEDGTSVGIIGDYLDELAGAHPEAAALPAFAEARTAVARLEDRLTVAAAVDLAGALETLAADFDDRPDATLFPESLADTAEAREARRRIEQAFDDLPASLDALAAVLAARPDDIFLATSLDDADDPKIGDAIDAFVADDRTATRFYVSTTDDPYSQEAFAAVSRVQGALAAGAGDFGPGAAAHLGGTTAQFADVQHVLAADFTRVGIITVLGILIVLMILLRAVVAPIYLVATVLLSCATALGLSSWFFQEVLGHPGVSFYLPILVFVLLVAIGSDYNIFLMSRVREESAGRVIHEGIRIASGRTGAVITSAGLILAGTFAAMMTADLAVLFQVGMAVAVGVLIDTFLVRSILVPAITTLFDERAWWPSGRAIGARSWPAVVTVPVPVPAGRAASRRLVVGLGLAAVVPLLVTGLLAWSFNDPAGNLDGVRAAVVNLDTGATLTDAEGTEERVDLGAEIEERLTAGSSDATFAWVAATADDARRGLASGDYGVVLTVPADFSASLAAVLRGDAGAEPARLQLETDDAVGYALGTAAGPLVESIAAETGREVTAGAIERMLRAVDAARAGLDGTASDAGRLAATSTSLADRAADTSALADDLVGGLGELTDGMATAGSGVGDLADGAGNLARGSDQLADGATGLARGAKTAASGMEALTGGADDLAAGLAEMRRRTTGFAAGAADLDAGAQLVDAGVGQLAAGATTLATAATTTAAMAGQLEGAVTEYAGTVESLAAGCTALGGGEPLCSQLQALAGGNPQLLQLAGGVSASTAGIADGLANADPRKGLAAGATALVEGTGDLADGTGALATSAPALEKGIAGAAKGADALARAAGRMAGGMDELAAGTTELGAAARAAAAGAARLADGTSAAADGASTIGEGMAAAAEGARLVAAGVDGIADDGRAVAADAGDVAAGLEDEAIALPAHPAREALDDLVADPIAVVRSRLHPAATEGTALAPLLAAIGLWIGALAAFLVLPAFLGRVDPRRPWRRVLAGFGAAAVLGLVQAALLILVLPLGVGIDAGRLPELALVAALAAVAFLAVNQALVALFGSRGWLVSVVLLALQVAAVGALYPVATAPEVLQVLRFALPMTFAVDGFRALILGGPAELAPALVGLAGWMVGALVVTLAVAHRPEPAAQDEVASAAP